MEEINTEKRKSIYQLKKERVQNARMEAAKERAPKIVAKKKK